MLEFDSTWRYESPGKISEDASMAFVDIILKISRSDQEILEHFKSYFGISIGLTSNRSSSAGWAETDLLRCIDDARNNAALYIEAVYDSFSTLGSVSTIPPPDVAFINRLLAKHRIPFKIEPPRLLYAGGQPLVSISDVPKSLDQEARELIQRSISEGQRLLLERRYRQAVQEVLWLLETVSTVFQGKQSGEMSIEGKYFNRIIDQLRRVKKGSSVEQILGWMTKMHGYLSAPSGGGVRHGMNLKDGIELTDAEGKLYFNLIVTYVSFLLSEFEQIENGPPQIPRNSESDNINRKW